MNPKIDREFKALIPPISTEEFEQLERNILSDGCRDALVIWGGHGILLDGHNRLDICQRHDIPFRTMELNLNDRESAEDWIDANQLGRRNLTPDAFKLLLGRRYNRTKKSYVEAGALKSRGQIDPGRTAEKLAMQHGVSSATVKRAGKFAEEVERNPELKKAIVEKVPVTKAKREKRKEDHATNIRLAASKPLPREKLWTVTDDQSVVECSVLITDPPYGILDLHWEPGNGAIEDVTRLWATRWDGCGADIILTFWSQRFLWQGRDWFDESFLHYDFQQLLIWHYPNNKSPQSRLGFKQTWEPIFMYRRKDASRRVCLHVSTWGDGLNDFDCHVAAVPQSNFTGADCKMHPAQKPLSVMRWLVAATTKAGELVCDPFCGSGTTGIAAVQLGRRFHGIEKDKEYLSTATGRLNEYGAA